MHLGNNLKVNPVSELLPQSFVLVFRPWKTCSLQMPFAYIWRSRNIVVCKGLDSKKEGANHAWVLEKIALPHRTTRPWINAQGQLS